MSQANRSVEGLPIKEGALFGAASFVGGYVVTLVLVALGESDDMTEDLIEAAGWMYYNAQFADIELSVSSDGFGAALDGTTFNYLTDSEAFGEEIATEIPALIYHLIPIVVLVGAGFLLARYVGATVAQEGAMAGALLPAGTLPLTLIGTFVFQLSEEEVSMAPVLVDSLLLVGIIFPAILGAIGGFLRVKTLGD